MLLNPHFNNNKILTHIIFDLQTIHLNNLSILNLKMKIFFALALVIVFPRSVVLDAGK